jgi:hypothetical protein
MRKTIAILVLGLCTMIVLINRKKTDVNPPEQNQAQPVAVDHHEVSVPVETAKAAETNSNELRFKISKLTLAGPNQRPTPVSQSDKQ